MPGNKSPSPQWSGDSQQPCKFSRLPYKQVPPAFDVGKTQDVLLRPIGMANHVEGDGRCNYRGLFHGAKHVGVLQDLCATFGCDPDETGFVAAAQDAVYTRLKSESALEHLLSELCTWAVNNNEREAPKHGTDMFSKWQLIAIEQ